MPEQDAKLLDIRTSPVPERIAAIDDFVGAGYEVHLNISPVVLRDGWQRDRAELLTRLDDEVGETAKRQAATEVLRPHPQPRPRLAPPGRGRAVAPRAAAGQARAVGHWGTCATPTTASARACKALRTS
jgi:hypothetical protein